MSVQIVHCGAGPIGPDVDQVLTPVAPATAILDLSGIELTTGQDLSPVVRDLVTTAAYVLLADGAVSRGRLNDPLEHKWRREMLLRIPVSDPDRWRSALPQLIELLAFATEDSWAFEFRQGAADGQLTLNLEPPANDPPTCVCMFSGGLDSLTGALRLVDEGDRPVLASHWTSPQGRVNRQRVVEGLRLVRPAWRFPNAALHTMRATLPAMLRSTRNGLAGSCT